MSVENAVTNDWNPLLKEDAFAPSHWGVEREQLRDPDLLEPALAAARRVFDPEWAAEFTFRETDRGVRHPALLHSVVRPGRWKLLLAGAAIHLYQVSDDTIEKLREAPSRGEQGDRRTRYADTIAELTTGLLVGELGYVPKHEPKLDLSPKKIDWRGDRGDVRIFFEAKRPKQSVKSLTQTRITTIFSMRLTRQLPINVGQVSVRLGRAFDEATRLYHDARESVAEALADKVAQKLPPADGTPYEVIPGVTVTRMCDGEASHVVGCSCPEDDNDDDCGTIIRNIDDACGQLKKSGHPGIVVLTPEHGWLATNYRQIINDHVLTKGEYLGAVLVALDDAPRMRFDVYPGAGAGRLNHDWSAMRPCACGAAHLDILAKPVPCELAEYLATRR